tara:strand:- start:53 stop:262 length:210 start_codon:yes stop_codon:yes gene_type:complete
MNGKKQNKSGKKGNMICKKMRVNGQMKKVCKPVGKAKSKQEALMRRYPKKKMTAQEGKKQTRVNRITID